MYAVERQHWLVERARRDGRVDVQAVADELDVAPETVRRDLKQLEGQSLLRRVHGGAIPVERLGFEAALGSRSSLHSEEKREIAVAAAGLLENAESIYLDEGSTTQLVAEQLVPDRPLTVITNALAVASLLTGHDLITVIILGGRVRPQTNGTVDYWASDMLESFVIDLAILGTNGVSAEHGCTCPDAGVTALKRRVIQVSRRKLLVADSSKLGTDSSYRFAQLSDFETFVTDGGADSDALAAIRDTGLRVLVV